MIDALTKLPFLPPFRLQVNNRKLIQGFYQGLGLTQIDDAMRIIDKLDKIPAEEVARLLVDEAGASPEQADACLGLAEISTSDVSFVERVRKLGVDHPLLDEGLTELAGVMEGCAPLTE